MEIINKQLEEMEQINREALEEQDIFRSKRLFKCILGLNRLETRVFEYLLKKRNVSAAELTANISRDRSSIQRALNNLNDLNLIKKSSMSIKEYRDLKDDAISGKRGYLYVYNAMKSNKIKNELREILDKWYKTMITYLNNLEDLFECHKMEEDIC